jgi:hypothetical protein
MRKDSFMSAVLSASAKAVCAAMVSVISIQVHKLYKEKKKKKKRKKKRKKERRRRRRPI